MAETIVLYGIPNCDTCRRARRWLDEQKLAWRFHDFKRSGVPPQALERWLAAEPALVNRRGTSWRALSAEEQAVLEDARQPAARALIAAHASLIKRPIIAHGEALLFGWTDEVRAALKPMNPKG